MAVPNRSFARVGGHLEILRKFEAIGRAGILAQSTKHAARGVVGERRQDFAPGRVVALPADDNQIFRAGQRAKIACNAQSFACFWIDIEPRRAAIPLRDHGPLQRILLRINVFGILRTEGQQQALPEIDHKHAANYFHHKCLVCDPPAGLSRQSGSAAYRAAPRIASLDTFCAAQMIPTSLFLFTSDVKMTRRWPRPNNVLI
jgi:hypothetical protein